MKTSSEAYLDSIGIPYSLIFHEPVYTVAESMVHLPSLFPVKNLLLQEEKGSRLVFIIMKGDERLNMKTVVAATGTKKLQFAKPEILMEKLGVLPGSASLFSLLHNNSSDVEVLLDSRLRSQPSLGFHPSDNTQTLVVTGQDIYTFLDSLGRSYREIDL